MAAGHVVRKPVASFHDSTTYGPAAAIETSDCPCADTPAGVTSSLGLAASAFCTPEGPSVIAGGTCVPFWSWGPKQNAWAADDASYCLPSRAQNGLPAWDPVVRRLARVTGDTRAALTCLARAALAAPAGGTTPARASVATRTA